MVYFCKCVSDQNKCEAGTLFSCSVQQPYAVWCCEYTVQLGMHCLAIITTLKAYISVNFKCNFDTHKLLYLVVVVQYLSQHTDCYEMGWLLV